MIGILSTLLAPPTPRAASRDPADDRWWSGVGGGTVTSAGVTITPDTAMRVSTVHACVKVLAETIASLPLNIHERRRDGRTRVAVEHPLHDVLHRKPNDTALTSFAWRESMIAQMALRGNAYNEILPGPRGAVDQLVPLHADRVQARRLETGRAVYQVMDDGGRTRVLTQDEVWHVPALVLDAGGLNGLSVIGAEAAANAVGIAAAAADHGGHFYRNYMTPVGAIKMAGNFKEPKDRENFRKDWRSQVGGRNALGVAFLPNGMEFQQFSLTHHDAQYLETRQYQDVDIARVFRVPPHMVGILDRATFSNIEQQALEFVKYTLLPWLKRIEQSINVNLILRPDLYFAKFNVDSLLRGELLQRYQAFAIGRNWGWLSANDVRRVEDMNGIGPEGDVYLRPGNMLPADSPAEPSGQGAPARPGAADNGARTVIPTAGNDRFFDPANGVRSEPNGSDQP